MVWPDHSPNDKILNVWGFYTGIKWILVQSTASLPPTFSISRILFPPNFIDSILETTATSWSRGCIAGTTSSSAASSGRGGTSCESHFAKNVTDLRIKFLIGPLAVVQRSSPLLAWAIVVALGALSRLFLHWCLYLILPPPLHLKFSVTWWKKAVETYHVLPFSWETWRTNRKISLIKKKKT